MVCEKLARAALTSSTLLFLVSVPAWADAPPNAPQVTPPGSSESSVGLYNWQSTQESTPLRGPLLEDPYYGPKGIPMGAFRLFPTLVLQSSFDDNVFRVKTGARSDVFFTETPSLVLDYNIREVHAKFYADGQLNQYVKLTTVDNDEFDVGTRVSYAFTRATEFSFNVSESQLAEPLSSVNLVPAQSRPELFRLFDASAQLRWHPNRIGFSIGGMDDTTHYLKAERFGLPALDQSDRDDSVYRGFATASYDFSPGYSVFVRGAYNTSRYAHPSPNVDRNSHGEEVDAGVNLLLGNLIQGNLYVGYMQQFYRQHQSQPLPDQRGLSFGANISWYPTDLLTVSLAASRQYINTTLAGASGGDEKNVDLSAAYELTRRLFLNADVGYDDTSYKGSVPYRADSAPTFGVGAKYLLSHYVQIQTKYQYTSRSSTVAGVGFDDSVVSLGLNLQI